MDLKIPKEFQIFGIKFNVLQPHKVILKGESILGKYDPDKNIIEIRRNLRKDIKEQVFLHELTHAILLSLGYTKLGYDEIFVERISKVLHQALKTMK